jgi:hypothetical protein
MRRSDFAAPLGLPCSTTIASAGRPNGDRVPRQRGQGVARHSGGLRGPNCWCEPLPQPLAAPQDEAGDRLAHPAHLFADLGELALEAWGELWAGQQGDVVPEALQERAGGRVMSSPYSNSVNGAKARRAAPRIPGDFSMMRGLRVAVGPPL